MLVVVSAVAIHRYPLFKMVMSVQEQYSRHKTPGMYLVPSTRRLFRGNLCSPLDLANREELALGNLKLGVAAGDVVDKRGEGDLHRIEFVGKRVLVRLPGIPDVDDVVPNSSRHLAEKFHRFLSRKKVSTRSALVSYILRVIPDELSFFDDPLTTIGNTISLHLKRVLVPPDANTAYKISVNKKLTGYLVASSRHDQAITFVQLFDNADHHYQLVFSSFEEKDIECMLTRILIP